MKKLPDGRDASRQYYIGSDGHPIAYPNKEDLEETKRLCKGFWACICDALFGSCKDRKENCSIKETKNK